MDFGLVIVIVVLLVCGASFWSINVDAKAKKHQTLLADTQASMKLQLDHEERMLELHNEELRLKLQLAAAEKPKELPAPKQEPAKA